MFAHIVLADEINRATPKTQSALLEAMQERHRSRWSGRATFCADRTRSSCSLPRTRSNMEGTYPLPEAQLDRFMFKIDVASQGVDALVEILRRTTGAEVPVPEKVASGAELCGFRKLVRQVPVSDAVLRYAASLVRATAPSADGAPDRVRRFVRYGASPRGAQAMILGAKATALLAGRVHVDPQDVTAVAVPSLRHRILLNFEGEAEGVPVDDLVADVLAAVSPVSAEVQQHL